MNSFFLEMPWQSIWCTERQNSSREELAAQCTGMVKWNPACEMAEPFVHNVVSTSRVHSAEMPINLERLSLLMKNSTYDKKKFAAITIRTYNPFCTALLFTSGKLVVTGVQSFYECVLASLSIMKIINLVYPLQCFRVRDCIVQNMVAHSTFELGIDQKFDIQVSNIHCISDANADATSDTRTSRAANVRTHAGGLHVPAKHVPGAHIPLAHLPSGDIMFFFGQSRADGWEDHRRHTCWMAHYMGHKQAFHQVNTGC
jgi:hypothetical protein